MVKHLFYTATFFHSVEAHPVAPLAQQFSILLDLSISFVKFHKIHHDDPISPICWGPSKLQRITGCPSLVIYKLVRSTRSFITQVINIHMKKYWHQHQTLRGITSQKLPNELWVTEHSPFNKQVQPTSHPPNPNLKGWYIGILQETAPKPL